MRIHSSRKQYGSHRMVPGSAGSPVAAPQAASGLLCLGYGEVMVCFGVTV